jgi:hypothetical protein
MMTAVGVKYELPSEKKAALERAKRVEWASISFLLTIVFLLAIVMGASQTMNSQCGSRTL